MCTRTKILLSTVFIMLLMVQAQAGFFSRGYVNYLLNRQSNDGVVPLTRVSSPTKSLEQDENRINKRRFLGVSPWLAFIDQEDYVQLEY
uniref:Secreted protein n=1 Tax=Steinernema glaseri TaxID=37863 RepID=A0A1I7YJ35_9BILA